MAIAQKKRLNTIGFLFLLVVVVAFIVRFWLQDYYNKSISMIDNGNYSIAEERLRRLGDYKECFLYLELLSGIELFNLGQYEEALKTFSSLNDFKASQKWLYISKYEYAKELFENRNYEYAIQNFTDLNTDEIKAIEGIENVEKWINRSKYGLGQQFFDNGNYIDAIKTFSVLGDYEDAQDCLKKSKYAYAIQCLNENNYGEAIGYFLELDDYKLSMQYTEQILDLSDAIPSESLYLAAIRHFEQGLYRNALFEFEKLNGYEDSEKYVAEAKQMLRKSLSSTMSVGLNGSVAITVDNKVVRTPYSAYGLNKVDNWEDIVSISYFDEVAIGLKSDGSVVTTSNNINLEIENEWIKNDDIIAVSAGQAYIIGLKSDGTLVSAGHDEGDNQRDVAEWKDIIAVATGWRHTVGLNSVGDILITGYGSSKQLNQISVNKEAWTNIIAIAAGGGGGSAPGGGHTVGLRKDGRVVAVGDNSYNQCEVDEWENIKAIAAGDWFTVGLCENGDVVITQPEQNAIGNLYLDACNAAEWSGIVSIAAGGGSVLGVHKDGSVEAAGYGANGQKDTANNWEKILFFDTKE